MMIYENQLLKFWNSYNPFFIFFFIFSPIFISLDFSHGIKFNANAYNLYSRPSVSISFFILVIISLLKFKKLIKHRNLIFLCLLLTLYIFLNIYNDTLRALVVGAGMMLPLISFYAFKSFSYKFHDPYKMMYLALFTVIILKFIFDIYAIYVIGIESTIKFNTWNYIIDKIVIYSFQDYFTFIYYLATVLSIQNIINNTMIKRSLILIIISNLAILGTDSRLFIYGIYLLPIVYMFYKITNYKLKIYFYLFMSVSISISLLIGSMNLNFKELGFPGLEIRNMHIYDYFHHFSIKNLFFPFDNLYRKNTSGSLHNEFVEIFSFFGFVFVYYYYFIMKLFKSVEETYKLTSYLLMFIILIGSLIQINISNPYIGIMLGMVLAIISRQMKEIEK